MMVATATGWVMYGSPEILCWPSCAFVANACARRTRSRSSPTRRTESVERMPSTSDVGGGIRARAGFSGSDSTSSAAEPSWRESATDIGQIYPVRGRRPANPRPLAPRRRYDATRRVVTTRFVRQALRSAARDDHPS